MIEPAITQGADVEIKNTREYVGRQALFGRGGDAKSDY